MRWQGQRRSANVEDRRGSRAVRLGVGGGLGAIVLVVLYLLTGGDPNRLLESLSEPAATEEAVGGDAGGGYVGSPEEESLREFVSVVLARTEDTWHGIFREMGRSYREPKLVLFTGAVDSGCGFAQAAVGPFYCPRNEKVYIDLSFYGELQDRFGASGDFAQAYVIAHEVGHHVQNLLGISADYEAARQRVGTEEANALSVRLELQADCFAGIWAHDLASAGDILEAGDIEEAVRAAGAIGDDRMQMRAQGYVAPDSFTHGTADQRARWFLRGRETGDIGVCDTFRSPSL